MSTWLLSFGAGILIGLLYALLKVRSPAPPAIALTGLLGMVLGGVLATQGSALLAQNSAQASHPVAQRAVSQHAPAAAPAAVSLSHPEA
ncbi:DUF1427 family protein (plasmid) [Chimaeribacter arupi]|uniref:DUF1427 family protein n=1 Tax=Nissabacter archeti TaxID=1917880 RepID=A0ABS5JHE7_9GAMM|nr:MULTISPECIES: DUF1427 family protein [Yersiniaceae]MBS0969345.1 DUF1427 family protein [Nissabacter archeti]WKZ94721.1 DUF1427 family protein [Chimaeribacter arupi]